MAESALETRTVTAALELRDADGPKLVGYASTFNEPYEVGFFREQIHQDAFKRTLGQNPDVRLLVDHEGQPLARTKSGTLRLTADTRGLGVDADRNPKDPDWTRLEAKMERGDLDQMSFAFRVPAGGDSWDYTGDMPMRTIREINLSGGDVSVVTYPANEGTSVQMRAKDERQAAFTVTDAMLRELREGKTVDIDYLNKMLTILAVPSVTRAGPGSFNDTESALSDALQAQFGGDDGDEPFDLWVMDAGDGWVVFKSYGDTGPGVGTWQMAYTMNADGSAALDGDPIKVTIKTDYVPAADQTNSGLPSDLARRLAEADAARRSAA